MKIKVQENFGSHLTAFSKKYAAISDKAIERLEDFFKRDDPASHPRLKYLMAIDAFSYRMLGNDAPGGPRIVMAKGEGDSFVPLFIGNHRDYEKYLRGNKIELEIEGVGNGNNLVTLETDDYKKAVPVVNDPIPRHQLEYSFLASAEEGHYITCKTAGITFTEAQLAVFESLNLEKEAAEGISQQSVIDALGELKTAKELVLECGPSELAAGVLEFQSVFYEMDTTTRSDVFDHLGVKQDWSSDAAHLSIDRSLDEFGAVANGENTMTTGGPHLVLLMADFQQQAEGVFADHLVISALAHEGVLEEAPETT